MKSRGMVVGAAVLLAAIATTALFMYVSGVRDAARRGGDRIEIVVSDVDIPAGTDLDPLIEDGTFVLRDIPMGDVIPGAVKTLEDLQHQTTSAPILAGEQLAAARLQGGKGLPGGTLGIPAGHVAITIPLDVSRVAGGAVQPGDQVTIYGTFEGGPGGDRERVTVTLVPDVKILRVQSPDDGSAVADTTSANNLVTLALSPADAQELVFAQEEGLVWLGLLPPGQEGKTTAPTTLEKVIQ